MVTVKWMQSFERSPEIIGIYNVRQCRFIIVLSLANPEKIGTSKKATT